MIRINPINQYKTVSFGAKTKNPDGVRVFHTDNYKTFDTVIVKRYPDGFNGAVTKAYMGWTKQNIKTTPVKNIKLDPRKGLTIEFFDKNQNTIKALSVNAGHDISKNTATLERWAADDGDTTTIWIKIPIGEKFVKPRAELIKNGKRVARIVLDENGKNIASERDEYSNEDIKSLYDAIKSLINEAKNEEIEFPYNLAKKWFKV